MTPQPTTAQPSWIDRHFGGWPRFLLFAALLVACCLTRLLYLGSKNIMHDESLFTYYAFEQMYTKWEYRYLPILHGPAHLMLNALVWHVFGVNDYTMRLQVGLLGIGGFFWIWSLRDRFGDWGRWIALLFYTLSPGVTNFQRFFREDGLFTFTTLWIVASAFHWWRTRNPRWAASLVFAWVVLFCNKESSLFVYFTVVTFLMLLIVNDLSGWLFRGKDESIPTEELLRPAPKFVSPWLGAGVLAAFVTLTLTQCFEGITYDADVQAAIGHDYPLRDVRSIPMLLGLAPEVDAAGAGAFGKASTWRLFYGLLAGGSLGVFFLLKAVVDCRLGRAEIATRLWRLMVDSRWYLLGAIAGGYALYLGIFTSFFTNRMGPFAIYSATWSYWGGQHEWGRIGGPFHMHSVNLLVYELPSVLIVGGAWLWAMCCTEWTRATGVALLLCLAPAKVFDHLLFSGLQVSGPDGQLVPLDITYFDSMLPWGFAAGIGLIAFPRSARFWFPVLVGALAVYSLVYFNSSAWDTFMRSQLFRGGEPMMMKGVQDTGATFLEAKLNMDGGWNLWYVMTLVVFATVLAWAALERGERFHAFLIWWFVTSLGAASYAREAVPQVGIHAAIPLFLLAASYADRLLRHATLGRPLFLWALVLGVMVLWNAKANFILNFHNADDIREKMVYGHGKHELRDHADFVLWYHGISGVRTNMVKRNPPLSDTEEWIAFHNEPERQKQTRVLVKGDAIWPLRWYLRDIEWTEWKDVNQAIDEKWEFMFLDPSETAKNPRIGENYNVFRGRSTAFWTPNPLDMDRLLDTWRLTIPGHYLDQSPDAVPAYNAKQEWRTLWRYLWRRETFDGKGRNFPSVSAKQYIFCVRKDLF